MSERLDVRLGEYESVALPEDQLTSSDRARLASLPKRFTLTPARVGWLLKAEATVGVLNLDRIRLVVNTKLAFSGESLIRWLCYALATPVPHETTIREWSVDRDGFADIVAAALLGACRTLLRDGLRRDYVRNHQVIPVLRGRFDAVSQATHRYGTLDRLHVDTFDRSVAIWENEVCGHALRRASTLVRDPQLSRQLSVLAVEFPTSSTIFASVQHLNRARYNRLNRRYQPAHLWAGLVLNGGGVADLLVDNGATGDSLLLDMPRLWEAVIVRLVGDAAPAGSRIVGSAGPHSITVHGDLNRRTTFRPDVLLQLPNGTFLPADAKYKTYGNHRIAAPDVHQLLTYTAGYATDPARTGVIIYPSPHQNTHRTLDIRANGQTLGTIHAIGIATVSDPAHALEWVRAVIPSSSRRADGAQ
ncbi:McrC family protein [Nocardia sp. NPDC058480]|uniref:McrC family protein n=1 Tax=unclassified Nocardia TaxID=2637762 RepID=UPI00364D3ECC